MSMNFEDNLKKYSIELEEASIPAGNYVPYVICYFFSYATQAAYAGNALFIRPNKARKAVHGCQLDDYFAAFGSNYLESVPSLP